LGLTLKSNDPGLELVDLVRSQKLLIILDSCEHVIEAVASLAAQLYRQTEDIYVLTTSRELLKIEGEHCYHVPPLDCPPETGLLVAIRGSKTDQERHGVTIAIARGDIACPVRALGEWLSAAGIEEGPIFRPIDKAGTVRASRLTCRSVANIVKVYAERAGFDASTFSGHSLRAGFLTSAASKGASIFKMMDVSRHKSVDTLRGYIRDAELFKDHAGAGLTASMTEKSQLQSASLSRRSSRMMFETPSQPSCARRRFRNSAARSVLPKRCFIVRCSVVLPSLRCTTYHSVKVYSIFMKF
jgi:hypothetical protein